jgi:hypothetical protein
MTPKEKARTLTNKFAKIEPYLPTKETILFMYEAKQCAIICVDEMLEHAQMIETEYEGYKNPYEFLTKVKHEISLL